MPQTMAAPAPAVPSPSVLVVEDDPGIREGLAASLAAAGLAVRLAADAREMDLHLDAGPADVVLLDVMLPGEDGLSACRRLVARGQAVILVTALGAEADRVRGLDLGADDYVAKPFGGAEIVARVRAVARRAGRSGPAPHPRLAFAGWTIDGRARTLHDPEGSAVTLPGAEFEILLALCRHAGEVLPRQRIQELTHAGSAGSDARNVDVHVSRLRQKIEANPAEPALVKTVRLGGYVLAVPVSPA